MLTAKTLKQCKDSMGRRKSGIGGADGKHGLEEYLTTQVVYLQLDNE